ncbi:hypothetical protein [Bacillus mojavensis]|uniref:hypothetical protein n=1 Tax=Bacillus mojavensis TaxID=72360 RepID=UPI002DB8BD5E|nr:hypothetical protein [Bacillus mojavensis]MEC1685675.1 hypothetical protein [Bacillus mojavensis]MEC1707776.1 hypothetical protein [Bacillus mojavensis]
MLQHDDESVNRPAACFFSLLSSGRYLRACLLPRLSGSPTNESKKIIFINNKKDLPNAGKPHYFRSDASS